MFFFKVFPDLRFQIVFPKGQNLCNTQAVASWRQEIPAASLLDTEI